MSVYAFNFLPNEEYSNLLVLAAFPSKSFFGKISLAEAEIPVISSHVLLYFVIGCLDLFLNITFVTSSS